MLLVGNRLQGAREGAGMRLGRAVAEETGQHGRLVGRNQECYLGPSESEKTSFDASRDALEASECRSVVLREKRSS